MKISCEVRSFSHRCSKDCFEFFTKNSTNIQFPEVNERGFVIEIDGASLKEIGSEDLYFHAHMLASSFLVALNIATVGFFCWGVRPSFSPIYQVREQTADEAKFVALSSERKLDFETTRDLNQSDIERTILIFGSLTHDKDSNSRKEYLKGLLHLGAAHLDVDFNREAFGNFYRCMESFVTQKILRASKLTNELKDIQRALESVGADKDLQEEFKEVYVMRSSQVAHAQNQQVKVSFDDAIKAKAFADIVMHRTYIRFAEASRDAKHPMRPDTPADG